MDPGITYQLLAVDGIDIPLRGTTSDLSLADSVRRHRSALDLLELEVTATVQEQGRRYRRPTVEEIEELEAAFWKAFGRDIRALSVEELEALIRSQASRDSRYAPALVPPRHPRR